MKEAFGDEVDDVVYMIDDVVKLSQVAGTIQKYNLYEQIAKLDVEIHVKKTQQQMKHALGLLQGGHAVK